jgi:hypothetical protein
LTGKTLGKDLWQMSSIGSHQNSEVMNVIGGRLQTTLDEQGRAFILGLPRVETRPGAELAFTGACLTHFAGEGDLQFFIAMSTSRCPTVKIMKADIKDGLVLSQPIQIESVQPLPKGLQLNAETVAQLKEQGPDESRFLNSCKLIACNDGNR